MAKEYIAQGMGGEDKKIAINKEQENPDFSATQE